MNATGPAGAPASGVSNAAVAHSRPWLNSYPASVPPKIDEARIGTLVDFFRHALDAYAKRPAVESFGKRMSYGELGRAAAKVTSWLQSRKIGKGDRVAIMLPNVMAYPAIMYGVLIGRRGGQYQPALHAARAAAADARFRCAHSLRARELRRTPSIWPAAI